MRSILVYADRKADNDIRIDTAVAIARRAGGHLTVLVDTPVARYIAMDPVGGNYVMSEALEKAREDDDQAAAMVEDKLRRTGVGFEVLRSEEEPVTALAYAARLADLVIVSRKGRLAGDLALSTRAPVLALGDEVLALPVRRAVVAWDGGEQAAAALRAAVPLLASCQSVRVVCVTEKKGGFPAADALRYLSRHGVGAEFEEHERQDSTEKTLARAVADAHAELLVMGAYGKSRMREFLFGGVTAHFLDDDGDVPAVLLAH
ncbi:universal stress protein [Novosphingobium soli]|uniref:Universal stress protein n=1 Tax=Novosphingobium soli TaxID=574956 RepID=A0ABV6D1M6_9SPHN